MWKLAGPDGQCANILDYPIPTHIHICYWNHIIILTTIFIKYLGNLTESNNHRQVNAIESLLILSYRNIFYFRNIMNMMIFLLYYLCRTYFYSSRV